MYFSTGQFVWPVGVAANGLLVGQTVGLAGRYGRVACRRQDFVGHIVSLEAEYLAVHAVVARLVNDAQRLAVLVEDVAYLVGEGLNGGQFCRQIAGLDLQRELTANPSC